MTPLDPPAATEAASAQHPDRHGGVHRRGVLLAAGTLGAAAVGAAASELVSAEPAYASHDAPLHIDSGASQIGVSVGADGQGASIRQNAGAAAGTHALSCSTDATGVDNTAFTVNSTNPANSAVWITGQETGRGTVKISHVGAADGSDANAAALSVDLQTDGTAAQGIFVDATQGGTTGPLLQLRNAGQRKLRVLTDGRIQYDNPSNIAPADPLPASPSGYFRMVIPDGTTVRVPYYL